MTAFDMEGAGQQIAFPVSVPIRVDPDSIWPDPVALPSTLLPVMEFEESMLPTGLRRWVADIAERMNCPIDFVAVPAMIAAASLIGRRIGIRPEVHTEWTEAANLWGAIVGVPGSLKSPAVREAFTALRTFEAKAARDYEIAMEDLKPQQRLHEIMEQEAKRAAKAKLRDFEENPGAKLDALDVLREVHEPTLPKQVRYMVQDATPEKLGELCRDNPEGILLFRDELLTMFVDLDREEKASGRGMIMSGWTGLDGDSCDRIGRGTVRADAVNLSLFGTTQPNRLIRYMRDSLQHRDDGLIQRVQLLVWPDSDRPWVKTDRKRDEQARQDAMRCYERLNCIDPETVDTLVDEFGGPGSIPYLRFSPDAQEEFDRWRARLEAKVREPELSLPLKAHLSKYRGLIPRLALVCHLANGGVGPVSVQAWVMAGYWADYLESHARRTYAALETDNTDTAELILRRIRKGDLPTTFSSRDVYRNGWSGLKDRERVEHALKLLAEYDWLDAERVATGGKPKLSFTVNPKALKKPN
ncbi:YfjI family protein [Sphingomonas sp. DG1-23]|uniref:YfjI family protein n=1 Tax=Sphingomonas sp. DG1-23 TaxID=3068316 RepID=UPI00273EFD8A|nr:YfjI family protein [Sphingomonas sp. DG1-23]MDP5281411.1 YfjI family protein [Sphingomonas sp. DG1-23]